MSPSRRGVVVALATLLSLGAFLSGSGVVSPPDAGAEVTIGVDRGTIEMSLAPGQTVEDIVNVDNPGDSTLQVMLYTADAEYDEAGGVEFTRPTGEPGEYLQSPASWIRLQVPDDTKIYANAPYIELEPGESFPVRFQIDVPADAPPGDHSAFIFFHMFELGDQGPQTGSAISGRIGTRLRMRIVGDIIDDLSISELFARTVVIGDRLPYTVRVSNAGNIDKFYAARLTVGDDERPALESVLATEAVTYAGAAKEFTGVLDLEGVGIGPNELVALVDYQEELGTEGGTRQPATLEERTTIWVIPLWLAILVVVVVGVFVLWLTYRSVRRRAVSKRRGPGARSLGPDAADVGPEPDAAGTPHRGPHPGARGGEGRSADDDIRVPDSLFGGGPGDDAGVGHPDDDDA